MSDTVTRAFELPLQHTDKEVWPLLRECWQQATRLANWGVQQLLRTDIVRLPGMDGEWPPPMPPIHLTTTRATRGKHKGQMVTTDKGLYGLAGAQGIVCLNRFCKLQGGVHWWHGASQSVSCICKAVSKKYKNERPQVIWRRSRAPASYRYPHPWPVNGQSWHRAWLDASDRPHIALSLPGGEVVMRLRGGPEYVRQMKLFRQVVTGGLPRAEIVIRQKRVPGTMSRPGLSEHAGNSRVIVKMVAKVLVKERPGDRVLVLTTDPQSFWIAELDRRLAWVLNNDHMRRGIDGHAAHLRRLQRLSQDAKAKRRLSSNRAEFIGERMGQESDKNRNRLASWTHESAAHLVGFATRQKVGTVLYLDRDRGFMPRFPWSDLHSKLASKCAAAGIVFYTESGTTGLAEPDFEESAEPMDGEAGMIDIKPSSEDERWTRAVRLLEMAARKVVSNRRRKGSHPAVSAP